MLLLLTGITVLSTGLPRWNSGARSEIAPSALVTYTDPGNQFHVNYPRGWRAENKRDGGVLLNAGGQGAVDIRVFRLAARVDPSNLQDMRAVTDAILSTPTAHVTVLSTQVVHLGTLTGLYYLYTFPSGKEQGVHAHYFLFSGNRMFTIVCQAVPAAGFPAMAGSFDAVTQSFAVTAQR